jgi:hypothetical protein
MSSWLQTSSNVELQDRDPTGRALMGRKDEVTPQVMPGNISYVVMYRVASGRLTCG